MPHQSSSPHDSPEALRESPRHGFQGDRGARPHSPRVPASLTIAISREAGSRGGSIAHRAGEKLGWQVYTQEVLEHIAQEGTFRQQVMDDLPAAAALWVEEQLRRAPVGPASERQPAARDLAHMILGLGAQGEVILIGRGAGFFLPARTTLHVRLVAPLQDRVAYMSQWLRLTVEEAAAQVRQRDGRRNEFIETHFHKRPTEPHHYDLILNSSLLGEELCTDLIVQAARSKLNLLGSA